MTNEKFHQLVSRLEREAQDHPQQYKAKVFCLAAVGYLYIFGMLAVLLAITGALVYSFKSGHGHVVAIKFMIPLAALLYFIFKSLWVRIPAPDDYRLTKRNAPQLVEEIERMSRQLRGAKVHEIQINHEFNASVIQVPQLGILGWHKNILTVGLPLMLSLNKDQFRAVLAHELGHLSGSHGRFNGWIYRVRRTWGYLIDQLERNDTKGRFLFHWFSQKFAPYFNAYTFVLARANEYDADRCAAYIAGDAHTASALQMIHVRSGLLTDRFWSQLSKQAVHEADPPNAYSVMSLFLTEPIEDMDYQFYSRQALLRQTDYLDTHPSLHDRLQVLGIRAELKQEEQAPPASDHYLPDIVPLLERFDKAWRLGAGTEWKEKHEHYHKLHQMREELITAGQQRELTIDEKYQLADAVEELESQEAALPLYQDLITLEPNYAPAHFAVGRILSSLNKSEGIDHLTYCMKLEDRSVSPACHHLYVYHMKLGEQEIALSYIRQASGWSELQRLRQEEASHLNINDVLLNEQPDDSVLQQLAAQAVNYTKIQQAYVVRKQTKYITDKSVYVLIYEFAGLSQHDKEDILHQIANSTPSDDEFFVLEIDALTKMRSKLKKMNASPFYVKGKPYLPSGTTAQL